jgi:hypothetical protein
MRRLFGHFLPRQSQHHQWFMNGGGGKNGSYLIQVLSITPRYVRGPWSSP